MYKKVIKTMICLVLVFLVGLYILKIFFPEQFILAIENQVLIDIGNYIDNNKWAYYLFGILTSFITYWFYYCAVCQKWYLNWKEIIVVFIVIALTIVTTIFDQTLYTAISFSALILVPFIFKADFKTTAIMSTIHLFSQALSLSIRNLSMYVVDSSSLIIMISSFDCYLWLLFGYLYFNLTRKEVD